MNRLALVISGCLVLSGLGKAELRRLQIDGFSGDWQNAAQSFTDPAGDAGAIDILGMEIANDENSLVLHFSLAQELVQQNSNGLVLYLDTDHDGQTGTSVEGIGAELIWNFGSRSGSVTSSTGQQTTVQHNDIGLRILPSHSSTHFELALDLNANPLGQLLFPGNQLQFVMRDMGADRFPDTGAHSFEIERVGTLPELPCDPLARELESDTRLLSWNTLHASLFDNGDQAAYVRILGAVQPDIIVFQEIWDQSAAEVVDVLDEFLPEHLWQAAKMTTGNVLASRWPIDASWLIDPGYRNTAHLVDASESSLAGPLLVINVHLRCCGADMERQYEVDSIIHFLYRVRELGDFPQIPAQTPIVILGDFNMVGDLQQLRTLLTGDVQNQALFGPDSPPDWDDSEFIDLISPHCMDADVFTWYDTGSSYSPGRLDFVLYSDSVIEPHFHTTLWTASMPQAVLDSYGLQAGDAAQASDHIPRIVDFRPVTQTAVRESVRHPADFSLLAVHPNPFNPSATIHWQMQQSAEVVLEAWNLQGQRTAVLRQGWCEAGEHSIRFDGSTLPSGLYLLTLRSGNQADSTKVLLLK